MHNAYWFLPLNIPKTLGSLISITLFSQLNFKEAPLAW